MSQFEGLTLEKVGKGNLEEQFQEALAEAQEVIARSHDGVYVVNKEKELKVVIQLEVEVVHSVESGATVVWGGLTKIKRPARVRRGSVAYLAGGVVQVEKAKQADLFESGKGDE